MAFFKNSLTFEESVERFSHYMIKELEAIQKKEDEKYEEIITEKMEKLEQFWSRELDDEEEKSNQLNESELAIDSQIGKPDMPRKQRSKSLKKMASPSKSDIVSKKYEKMMQKVSCQEGMKCKFHKFHTGNKIIILNCRHAKNFEIRKDLQGAIIEGTLKNLDLPCKKIKGKNNKKFVSSQVPKSASIWEFVENALKSKQKT